MAVPRNLPPAPWLATAPASPVTVPEPDPAQEALALASSDPVERLKAEQRARMKRTKEIEKLRPEAARMYIEGGDDVTYPVVAGKYGVHEKTVKNWGHRQGWAMQRAKWRANKAANQDNLVARRGAQIIYDLIGEAKKVGVKMLDGLEVTRALLEVEKQLGTKGWAEMDEGKRLTLLNLYGKLEERSASSYKILLDAMKNAGLLGVADPTKGGDMLKVGDTYIQINQTLAAAAQGIEKVLKQTEVVREGPALEIPADDGDYGEPEVVDATP